MLPDKDVEGKNLVTGTNWHPLANLLTGPIKEGELTPIPNRRERRKQKQFYNPRAIGVKGELDRIQARLINSIERSHQVVDRFKGDPSLISFQGEPFVYDLLEISRKLPEVLERAHLANLETPFVSPKELNKLDDNDIFSKKIGGTRLLDIEQMELDDQGNLSIDNIRRINRIYNPTPYRRLLSAIPFLREDEDPQANWIKQNIFFFVCQQEARPEAKITVPPTLLPLHEKLTAYFDYYANLLTDFNLGFWQERNLYSVLAWAGSWLSQAVGCYIPAKFGFTPSSAIKLYQTRAEVSLMPARYWRKTVLLALETGAGGAFREHGLSADLQKYQHYDETVDKAATSQLVSHYKGSGSQTGDLAGRFEETEQLFDQVMGPYAKVLYEDVIRGQRRLNALMPDDHIVDRVLVTSQNRKSTIFILQFRDGTTHLTLEMDRNRKIYGISADMAINNPDVVHPLWGDVLGAVLADVKLRHPEIEPIRLSDYIRRPARSLVEQNQLPEASMSTSRMRIDLPVKREKSRSPRILTPILQTLSQPRPPKPEQSQVRERVVIYSRGMITNMMGGQVRPKDVDKTMGHIRRFELGQAQPKIIDWSGGKRYVDRVGDLRIVYNHLGRGTFVVEAIGDREKIYTDYGDFKV